MDDIMNKLQSVLSDEESMRQIRELADMFGAGDNDSSSPNLSSMLGSETGDGANPFGDIDIGKIIQLKGMYEQSKKSDKNTDLLLSLRPIVKDENKEKIDRVIKIFRLLAIWPLIKESGLLGGDFLGIL